MRGKDIVQVSYFLEKVFFLPENSVCQWLIKQMGLPNINKGRKIKSLKIPGT